MDCQRWTRLWLFAGVTMTLIALAETLESMGELETP